jgi:hypothetical protein
MEADLEAAALRNDPVSVERDLELFGHWERFAADEANLTEFLNAKRKLR